MREGHAVVVGGTKGLGLVVTDRFLDRGLGVTIISRNPAPEHAGNQYVRHLGIDLESIQSLEPFAGQLRQTVGEKGIRYLVLCQRFRGSGDPWQGEIQVGLSASRLLVEGLLELFSDAGDRAIGIVSSVYAEFVGGSQPLGYHVVKAGLNQMVRYYAWKLGRRGIRVNAIMPLTYVKASSRSYYQSRRDLAELYDRLVPLRRIGDVNDSANALDFLCSEKAGFINGQCLYVDGGVSVVWHEEVGTSFSDK